MSSPVRHVGLVGLVVLVLSLASASAEARRTRFGLGLVLGQPSGVSAEYVLSQKTSIDFELGLERFDDDALYVHADYLIRLVDVLPTGSVHLPLYVGIGAFVVDYHGGDKNIFVLGPRVPFGIQVDFQRAPVVIFLEIAVRFGLVSNVDIDRDSDIDGAVGFRYYF